MAINLNPSAIEPSAKLIADTGLSVGPVSATTLVPVTGKQVQLSPGALPNSLTTVIPAGTLKAVPVSAAFEINSIKGSLLLPRLTATQRDATTFIPCNGMMIYLIGATPGTDDALMIRLNGAWRTVTTT